MALKWARRRFHIVWQVEIRNIVLLQLMSRITAAPCRWSDFWELKPTQFWQCYDIQYSLRSSDFFNSLSHTVDAINLTPLRGIHVCWQWYAPLKFCWKPKRMAFVNGKFCGWISVKLYLTSSITISKFSITIMPNFLHTQLVVSFLFWKHSWSVSNPW